MKAEQLRRSLSQSELVIEARQWIKTHYPDSDPDTRMARLGLLIDFVTDLVPNSYIRQQNTSLGISCSPSEPDQFAPTFQCADAPSSE